MTADLAALIALRNARFRAWRAYGVPVAEAWRAPKDRSDRLWLVTISCSLCGARGDDFGHVAGLKAGEYDAGHRPDVLERNCIRAKSCVHLAPLLGEDPPEVVALTKLELLAGDPPAVDCAHARRLHRPHHPAKRAPESVANGW
jgi:hypothetical protein